MRPGFARARALTVGCVVGVVGIVGCLSPIAAITAFTSMAQAASPASAAPVEPAAISAATWLRQQLAQGQGLMPGLAAGLPDVGLTSDTLLSLVAAGQRQDPGFTTSLVAVANHLSGYARFPTAGTTALLAGPVAKTLFLAEVSGADPKAFGGVDLPTTLRSLLTISGPNAGRFSDRGTGSDTSNGFSQSFAILGLSRDPGGAPASAVSFLLAQQCPSGAFRLFYDTPGGCHDNSSADPDATSVTISALSQLSSTNPGRSDLTAARASAARWLASRQQPDGGLGGAGPTAGENVNTTALAAVAFRETGLTAAASAAQRYVSALQLTGGPDAGAVAYNSAALSAIGHAGTIPTTDADQWRRSSSQAILAFGLPGYDALPTIQGAPITPSPSAPHQTTPSASPPNSAPGSSTPAPVTSTHNVHSDPVDAAATNLASAGTNDSANDPVENQPVAGDQPATNNSAAPVPPRAASILPTNSVAAPLTHATPQAAVTQNSADAGVPRWVWILVAVGAGVGGGFVVLRLQFKRAAS